MQDLVAKTLLAPDKQRAVHAAAVPTRLEIVARHQALRALPAVLVERPAFGEAAEREGEEALIPLNADVVGLLRDHAVERGDRIFQAFEVGQHVAAHGERVDVVRVKCERALTTRQRLGLTAEFAQHDGARNQRAEMVRVYGEAQRRDRARPLRAA